MREYKRRRRDVQTHMQAVCRSRLQDFAVLLDSVSLRVPSEENLETATEVAGALAGTVRVGKECEA